MRSIKKSHFWASAALAVFVQCCLLSLIQLDFGPTEFSRADVLFVELEKEWDPLRSDDVITDETEPSHEKNALAVSEPPPQDDAPKTETDVVAPPSVKDAPEMPGSGIQSEIRSEDAMKPMPRPAEPIIEAELPQPPHGSGHAAGSLVEPSVGNEFSEPDTPSPVRQNGETATSDETRGKTSQQAFSQSADLLGVEEVAPVTDSYSVDGLRVPEIAPASSLTEPTNREFPASEDPTYALEQLLPDTIMSLTTPGIVGEPGVAIPMPEELSPIPADPMVPGARQEKDRNTEISGAPAFAEKEPERSRQNGRPGLEEYAFVWAETGTPKEPKALKQEPDVSSELPEVTVSEQGHWRRRCSDNRNPGTCSIVQEVFLQRNSDGEKRTVGRLLKVTVSAENETQPEGSAYLSIHLPLGVDLRPGVVIKIDGGSEIPLQYLKCTKEGCRVGRSLDSDLLWAMQHGTRLLVGFRPWGGSETNVIPAELEGFTHFFSLIQ